MKKAIINDIKEGFMKTQFFKILNFFLIIFSLLSSEIIDHPDQWYGGRSYSQHGEDLLVLNLFYKINIRAPTYLDLGAHHPYNISNTALLYKKNCRGINIECNPDLINEFYKERPKDINLCVAIDDTIGEKTFFMYDDYSGRNSLLKAALNDLKCNKTIKVPCTKLDDIISKYCLGSYPDLLSIDLEGLDYKILKSTDFSKSSPKIIIVEFPNFKQAIDFNYSSSDLINLLDQKGFFIYAVCGANGIFVRKDYKNQVYTPFSE